jgi:lysophospholipase L1-like esterase
MERASIMRPGPFGVTVHADSRRRVFDSQNEALLTYGAPIDAVFIGDSITDMWALEMYFRGRYGWIVNRGVAGDRTPFVRRRFEADVVQLRPRLAVVLIGINNTWDLDIWWDETRARTPEAIEEEIVADSTTMVRMARDAGIALALGSILPTAIAFNGNTAVRNNLVASVNRRLAQVAQEGGAVYVDYHRRLVAQDGFSLRPELADDGLHPHVRGYEIMAATLLDALAAANIEVITAVSTGPGQR